MQAKAAKGSAAMTTQAAAGRPTPGAGCSRSQLHCSNVCGGGWGEGVSVFVWGVAWGVANINTRANIDKRCIRVDVALAYFTDT